MVMLLRRSALVTVLLTKVQFVMCALWTLKIAIPPPELDLSGKERVTDIQTILTLGNTTETWCIVILNQYCDTNVQA